MISNEKENDVYFNKKYFVLIRLFLKKNFDNNIQKNKSLKLKHLQVLVFENIL